MDSKRRKNITSPKMETISSLIYGINPVYKILLALLIIIPAALLGGLMYLYSLQPQYSGRLPLAGLQQEVEIIFDPYGIPHIYGQSQEDVYFALGYVHAQERLFQMEMMRRVAAGRLAEILGEKLVKTDKFFRTLGLLEQTDLNVALFFKDPSAPWKKAALAYLAGVNQYVEQGDTPLEFRILGIPKEKFTPKDIYLNGALMAFGFAAGFQMDPLVTKVYHKLGWDYLKDWVLGWPPGAQKIPVYPANYSNAAEALPSAIHEMMAELPVSAWIGSNGWVVSGKKTKSGKVIFANDTHMAYSQPSVWYDFSQNPQSENPPAGFVYSANNQPDALSSKLYPGYYIPEDRARRIVQFLDSETTWSAESTKKMNTDCISTVFTEVTAEILNTLKTL